MIITCRCGQKNRLPVPLPVKKLRCGVCRHEFTPNELAKATHEVQDFHLEQEDDSVPLVCSCGWEGTVDDADFDDDKDVYRCPDCEKKLKIPEENDDD